MQAAMGGGLSEGFLVGGDKYMVEGGPCIETSGWMQASRSHTASVLKKLRTALFLVLVGKMPASGCHYSRQEMAYLWHRDLREYQKMGWELGCDLHACDSVAF